MSGGVGGERPSGLPLSRSRFWFALTHFTPFTAVAFGFTNTKQQFLGERIAEDADRSGSRPEGILARQTLEPLAKEIGPGIGGQILPRHSEAVAAFAHHVQLGGQAGGAPLPVDLDAIHLGRNARIVGCAEGKHGNGLDLRRGASGARGPFGARG